MASVSTSTFRARVRPSSSIADGLVDPLFGSAEVDAAVSDAAWLQAMLDSEAALAGAEADAGLDPRRGRRGRSPRRVWQTSSTLPISDAGQLLPVTRPRRWSMTSTAAVPSEARSYVHLGATSQDIIDTALSLVAQRALDLILADLRTAATACATLASTHRETLMTARTLLQPAVPTTFGLKAAAWLVAIDEARAMLAHVRFERLAVQLGGAAGTLAPLHEAGIDVAHRFAERLGLVEPVMPWHTDRTRIAELAAALGMTIGVLGKIARDVTLLAQAEVAEATERGGDRHGTSSTLPQKHNPVRAVLIIAAAERCAGTGCHGVPRLGAGARTRDRCLARRVGDGARAAPPRRRCRTSRRAAPRDAVTSIPSG